MREVILGSRNLNFKMDPDFQLQYSGLMVHHLERPEIEHELTIRAVQFEPKDSQAALRRRLRDRLKEEKGQVPDIDLTRSQRSIDEEIKIVDRNIHRIRQILENKEEFDGIRETLKTRLVHYFIRCSRIQEIADLDNDLEDLDKLKGSIRELMNNFFSPFSNNPAIREEVFNEIVRTLSSMSISQPSRHSSHKSKSEEDNSVHVSDNGGSSEPSGSAARRNLKSITSVGPRFSKEEGEKVLRRFRLDHYQSGVEGTDESSEDNRKSESDSSRDESPPRKTKKKSARSSFRKTRHVSEWNLRYDGKDSGQNLMRFIREAEFLAKSEGISKKELFRSAIYLFQGQAKTWFMTGIENQEFYSWEDLVREMKKEFLSPDHDHVSEFRAISRKQGSREKFQDYLFEMQKIFNSLTKPVSESRKFEIVFRNMRSDYKGHAVASNIDNLVDLKRFGRKLDSTFWYKYSTISEESTRNRANVNELRTGTKPKTKTENEKSFVKSRNFYRSAKSEVSEDEKPSKKPREGHKTHSESQNKTKTPDQASDVVQLLVDKHRPLKEGTCFNCRLAGHHHKQCDRPPHKFCYRCGFLNTDTKNCPWCAKNAQ